MATRPKVLCIVDLSMVPETLDWLRDEVELDYQPKARPTMDQTLGAYDAFWGHVDFRIDKVFFEQAKQLKVVLTASTGTDHIDRVEADRRRIRVLSITRDDALLDQFSATAECAWMLLLACTRRLPGAAASVFEGRWLAEAYCGRQLRGLTLGVLGVGRLGRMTAEFGKAFRMRVLGCDKRPFVIDRVEPVNFKTLLGEADAISIHIHMTADNFRLFDRDAFACMKPGAALINTSRGDIVDEEALLDALRSGRLGAYGADVLHDEWRGDMRTHPVVEYARTHDNVVITPHLGGCTHESVGGARAFAARKLVHYLKTGEELTAR